MMSATSPAAAQSPEDAAPSFAEDELSDRARDLAREHVIVDTHIDVPYRLHDFDEDVSERTRFGDFDYPRAREGGLNVAFMSIYIPVSYQETGGAKALADEHIDRVKQMVERAPDKFAMLTSPDDVQSQFDEGLVSLAMGMENGAGLEGELSNVEYFFDRGIRYITLAHGSPNKLSDSSYDPERIHDGLSDFGEDVVREMNRLGMMVDVSHITDEAFYDVMEITSAPVVATHSSARHFTPGWERNMSDEMIERLAEDGGVIMISFGSTFLHDEYQDDDGPVYENIDQYVEAKGLEDESLQAREYRSEQRRAHPIGTVGDVADHIDHVVDLVGVDYVGLGSDFDGVFALPAGLQDVSEFPNLVEELLRRGYSEEDISKILGGNLLRVWREVEAAAE